MNDELNLNINKTIKLSNYKLLGKVYDYYDSDQSQFKDINQ